MILNITVESFYSYAKPQTLSFIANDENGINAIKVGDLWVRKSAIIYGDCSNRISDFLKAIDNLRRILLYGIEHITYKVYKLPTTIEICFSVENDIYKYIVKYDAHKIYKEELYCINGDINTRICINKKLLALIIINAYNFDSYNLGRQINKYDFLNYKFDDALLLIDEDSNLFHPLFIENFIRDIHNSENNGQLIIVSHQPTLLNISIFERDQIYFANTKFNDRNELNELYSLADFTDVKDNDNWMSKYLTGNFGAIPR